MDYYYSRAGDYDRAITVYQRLLQQQPSQALWLYALGFQYQQMEQWPEAIAAYEQSRQLAPRWLLPTLRLGDRGFGFIKDDTDGARVFFHISRVSGRTAPMIGVQAKYLRELGEKGMQAAKVWLQ